MPSSPAAGGSWRLASLSMVMIASPQYVWALFTRPVTAGAGRDAGAGAGHLLDPDRGADVPVAGARPAGGPVRPAPAAVDRHGALGSQLGAGLAGRQPADVLPDLRPARGHRHRHRLRRRRRATWCSGSPTAAAWPPDWWPPATAWARCSSRFPSSIAIAAAGLSRTRCGRSGSLFGAGGTCWWRRACDGRAGRSPGLRRSAPVDARSVRPAARCCARRCSGCCS